MSKETTRSELHNGHCNVNVNQYDKNDKCISSEQYLGIAGLAGDVIRAEKTTDSHKEK